ncbi:MAG: S8 family serine peptidase [Thermoanaerobaculia bacterium]|nr:S8 family serine peptidase [Thermoanaerobaculia bacterium]
MKFESVVRWSVRVLRAGMRLAAVAVLLLFRVATGADTIGPQAAAQIQALLAEKDARTPAQRKLDSNLLYAVKMNRGEAIAAGISTLQTAVDVGVDSTTIVDIVAHRPDSLTDSIRSLGGEVIDLQPAYRSIRARMPLQKLETLAEISSVIFVQPRQDAVTWREIQRRAPVPAQQAASAAVSPELHKKLAPGFDERAESVRAQLVSALARRALVGSVTSQGDVTHRADLVRSTLGVTGAGVKVGVLSDGVTSLGLLQALGDLPAVTVLPAQAGVGDEGTAMLEIVHDVAPGAKLFFATAFNGITSFAQNIKDLRTAGCDIIIDDVTYFAETPFQKGQAPSIVSNTNGGIVTQAVVDVTAAGALFFSSAANSGSKDKATSGTWEGDFVDGGALGAPVTGSGNVHDFGGQNWDVLTTGGSVNSLHWSDPLGGSANDYDLFLLNAAGTVVRASSTNPQTGTQDPFEITGSESANDRLVIVRRTGAANRFLHLDTARGRLSISTAGSTHGHNAPPGPYAFGVAATPAAAAFGAPPNPTGPFPSPFSGSNTLELFSSDGPRRFFYNADSTPITPGDVSSTGGEVQQKPDFTAADGVFCGVQGFATFFGTSAASPHAGAIAALVKSANLAATQAQWKTSLLTGVIDIEAVGVDRDSGAGILDALAAVQATGTAAQASFLAGAPVLAEASGNGNASVEPGECATLLVPLTNVNSTVGATAISATLSTSTPGVTIDLGTSAYPNIAGGGTASNATPFVFRLATSVSCPLFIDFTLTVTYAGGTSPQVLTFPARAGRPAVVISETLGGAAPVPPATFTATTGAQTTRISRDGVIGTCGISKTVITAGAGTRLYDAYTFTNCSNSASCLSVDLNHPGFVGTVQLFASAYLGSFNPAAITSNYIADSGTSGSHRDFTFTATPGQTYVVVVSEVNSGAAASYPYTLTIDGLCAACQTYTTTYSCCPAIGLTPASLPNGTIGTPYSQVLTPTAGTAPFTFNVAGLPAGMTPTTPVVGSTVTIGGAPTAAFSGTVTVSGTDANGCPFTQDFPLTVGCPAPPPLVVNAPSVVGAGSPNRVASVAPIAGAVYTWSITNGTITGGQGTNQITFTAGTAGTTLTLTVNAIVGACSSGGGLLDITVAPVGSAVQFYTIMSCRLVDTRNANGPLGGPALAAAGGPDRAFTLTGTCGIPAGATAVSANLTVVSAPAGGFLAIYRGDGAFSGTSSISFNAGKTRAGNALLALDGSGTVKVNNSAAGAVHIVLDANGYFQ